MHDEKDPASNYVCYSLYLLRLNTVQETF